MASRRLARAIHGAALLSVAVMIGAALVASGRKGQDRGSRGSPAPERPGPASDLAPHEAVTTPENSEAGPKGLQPSGRPQEPSPPATASVASPGSSGKAQVWLLDPDEVRLTMKTLVRPNDDFVLTTLPGVGVRVDHVEEGARRGIVRGLQPADLIRSVNGIPIEDEEHFRLMPARLWPKVDSIAVDLVRDGRPQVITYRRADGSIHR